MEVLKHMYYKQLDSEDQLVYKEVMRRLILREKIIEISYNHDSLKIINAINLDNPQLFFVNWHNIKVRYTLKGCKFIWEYLYSIDESLIILHKAKKIANSLKGENDYDTVEKVHNYLIMNTKFSPDINKKRYKHKPEEHNLVGALFGGYTLCEGISRAAQFILNELHVDCSREGTNKGEGKGHMWNLVLQGEKICKLDITWDKCFSDDMISYVFFYVDRDFF